MKTHGKQDIIALVFAFILLVIVFMIIIITINNNKSYTTPVPSPTPAPASSISQVSPRVIFNSVAGAKLAYNIIHRQTLSSPDAAAKTATLTTILKGDNSGVVYKNSDVSVEYVQSVDLFMADILTTNINQAKTETVDWFISQGFSKQAVCNLPVMFYLDTSVSSELQTDIQFSPLANGC